MEAILVWVSGRSELPEGSGQLAVYELSGPVFEVPPGTDHYIVAPMDQGGFATSLYAGKGSLQGFRQFLSHCRLAVGQLSEDLQHLLVLEECPLLPLVELLGSESMSPLSYDAATDCFLLEDTAVSVLPEVYQEMMEAPEFFGTASVCEECGQAEDVSVFLWTTRIDQMVRVNFIIQNQTGIWKCWIAPFAVPVST